MRVGSSPRPPRLAAAALAFVLVAACGGGAGEEGELGVELTLMPSPPRVGDVQVEVALTDASGEPLRGAAVQVEGNMNHAGMVPEIASAEEVGPGRYSARIEFTMGGDWFFVISGTTAGGERFERVVQVPGVASGETGAG